MKYYEDPILGKGRAADVNGGTGGGGESYIGGYRITIAGQTISNDRYMPIESVSGNTVTLQAGHAYKAYATSTAITLNTETIPANQFGLEGHIELFVSGTGYVVTGTNVVLSQPLEPDSVNNCTVRFHDGLAIISVEDHVAGYIVTLTGGTYTTEDGTLYYGLHNSDNEYIAFDDAAGTVFNMENAVTNGEKHVVGNGYSDTIVTGGVSCTSKTTFANLAMSNVINSGGRMTMGDVFIPQGGTVTVVSGGAIAVENVVGTGSESVIDLGYDSATQTGGTNASCFGGNISGVTIKNGRGGYGGGLYISGGITTISDSVISGCYGGSDSIGQGGGAFYATDAIVSANNVVFADNTTYSPRAGGICLAIGSTKLYFSSCTFSGNANTNGAITLNGSAVANFTDCSIHNQTININTANKIVSFAGSNLMLGSAFGPGSVTFSSGAILDLTGNTNATPIAPGGGITFESGGATVLYSSGAVSGSYMMDNVELPAGAKLTNTAVVNLAGSNVTVASDTVASMTGETFVSGSAALGGAVRVSTGATAYISSCTFSGNAAPVGVVWGGSATLYVKSCTFIDNTDSNGTISTTAGVMLQYNTVAYLDGNTFGSNCNLHISAAVASAVLTGTNHFGRYILGSGTILIESGAIVDLNGNTTIANIAPNGGIVVAGGDSTKSCTLITPTNESVPIVGGNYTQINKDGTTIPAQPA